MDNSNGNALGNNYSSPVEILIGKSQKCNLYNPEKTERMPPSNHTTLTDINTSRKIIVPKELLDPMNGDFID